METTQAHAAAQRYATHTATGAEVAADDLGAIFGPSVIGETPLDDGSVITAFADGTHARLTEHGLAVYDSLRYAILVTPEPQGGYSVSVPDLPEVHTQGESGNECIANAADAVVVAVEARRARGEEVPAPLDDEPLTADDIAALDEARAEASHGVGRPAEDVLREMDL